MSPPPDSFFGSIPFDLVITTFVVLIVSFVLVMEEEAMVQKEEQEKLQRFAVLLSSTAQATGGAARRRSRDADETSTNPEEEQPKKRRYIFYDCAQTRDSILQDYIGPNPIFDAMEFQRMFRTSRNVYKKIKNKVSSHEFFSVGEYDCFGRLNICKDAKLMIALKHLAYGVATNSWRDYFQMGESTGRKCVEVLCHCIYKSKRLRLEFLRRYNLEDAKRVAAMHLQVHGVPGMLGSLDCMHVRWKNCPIAYQGVYMGKEKFSTIVLEAVADANLWFWHAAFGFAGSCNDINILDVSPCVDPLIAEANFTIDDNNVHQANAPRTYNDAEERVGAIEAEIAQASGNPHAQFHEDRIRLLSFTQRIVHERWTMLYNEKEHLCLQNSLINKVNKKTY